MLNKELFVLNPDENNLINDGVALLNTSVDNPEGEKIVRHEIKTFVCEGEYERGLLRILDTYLRHFDQPKQPAVWVSGFFGSGKSHLVKMLTYFWENHPFSDGVCARQIKALPRELNEQFVELTRKQDLFGSIVIRGLLRDFPSKDVKYSFLQLMLSNLGLPTKLHQFKFYYWCKTEGFLDELLAILESEGRNFQYELDNMYVSEHLAKAILKLKPDYAETEAQVRDQIGRNFQRVESISREDFLYVIKSQILPMRWDKTPCILVALDEVQQFIGPDEDRSHQMQLLAEDLCENFHGRLLFVGTGQNALTETPILQKLLARFTVQVPLSDKDVETVTRKTVLEKKSAAAGFIDKKLQDRMGEIAMKLEGSDFGFTQDDKQTLVADYPILPSTRKFWNRVLQAIDTAGTSGQLRSQLRIVDESVKSVADKALGDIIPADFMFTQKKQQLIQNATLLSEQSNIIESLHAKGGDDALKARILSVVFLIDLLPRDTGKYQLKATEKTIADLLIDSLNESSEGFRNKVAGLIEELVHQDKYLVPLDDEYKLQTRVGAEWEKEFTIQANKYRSDEQKLYAERHTRIMASLNESLKAVFIQQGNSKIRRDFHLYAGQEKPSIQTKLNLWVRDGWLENKNTLLDEIRAEGTDEPLGYLFVQKVKDQELRREMVKMLAAEATLIEKGTPSTPEGEQARKGMETRKKMALSQIKSLVEEICKEVKVYMAGGAAVDIGDFTTNVRRALANIADRQFPEFGKADFTGWDKALKKALNSDPQALQAIGYNGDINDHPLKADLFQYIGISGKKGKEIRDHFLQTPYGWWQDAVDAMLVALSISGTLSTKEGNLNQRTITQAVFKAEEIPPPRVQQKMAIRKLYLLEGIHCKSGNELRCSLDFLNKMNALAESIYGDAPKPEFVNKQLLNELMNLDGNERLLAIFENVDKLTILHERWKKEAETIRKRLPEWELLVELNRFASDGEEIQSIRDEIDAIRNERMILHEPDPIQTPLGKLTDLLRNKLNAHKEAYNKLYDEKMAELQHNEYFAKLEPDQKHAILRDNQLLAKPTVKSYDAGELLQQLKTVSLDAWSDKVIALPSKFQKAMDQAINALDKKPEQYTLPKRTIRNEADLENWLNQLRREIKGLLDKGDVILK